MSEGLKVLPKNSEKKGQIFYIKRTKQPNIHLTPTVVMNGHMKEQEKNRGSIYNTFALTLSQPLAIFSSRDHSIGSLPPSKSLSCLPLSLKKLFKPTASFRKIFHGSSVHWVKIHWELFLVMLYDLDTSITWVRHHLSNG